MGLKSVMPCHFQNLLGVCSWQNGSELLLVSMVSASVVGENDVAQESSGCMGDF